MSVEINAKFISEFNEAYPRKNDLLKEGDDHLRLIKAILKNTLPNFNREINISSDTLNSIDSKLDVSGDTFKVMSNFEISDKKSINLGGNIVSGVSDPVDDTDVVNKQYLETSGVSKAWPVGSIYFTMSEANPSESLGVGEWEKFASGRVIIGTGSDKDEYDKAKLIALGAKGGTYDEVLKKEQLPSHSHSGDPLVIKVDKGGNHRHSMKTQSDRMSIHDITGRWFRGSGNSTDYTENGGEHEHTGSATGETGLTGNGEGHNNMMPYIGVHIWKRTK